MSAHKTAGYLEGVAAWRFVLMVAGKRTRLWGHGGGFEKDIEKLGIILTGSFIRILGESGSMKPTSNSREKARW